MFDGIEDVRDAHGRLLHLVAIHAIGSEGRHLVLRLRVTSQALLEAATHGLLHQKPIMSSEDRLQAVLHLHLKGCGHRNESQGHLKSFVAHTAPFPDPQLLPRSGHIDRWPQDLKGKPSIQAGGDGVLNPPLE